MKKKKKKNESIHHVLNTRARNCSTIKKFYFSLVFAYCNIALLFSNFEGRVVLTYNDKHTYIILLSYNLIYYIILLYHIRYAEKLLQLCCLTCYIVYNSRKSYEWSRYSSTPVEKVYRDRTAYKFLVRLEI